MRIQGALTTLTSVLSANALTYVCGERERESENNNNSSP